ncbi:MAG TPA: hypothetical protein VFZ65_04150 [Planctomycetota bacterium]|nr:hypothetical protein [Planctomycetota bacterium]
MHHLRPNPVLFALPLLLLPAACADGGKQDTPQSVMPIAASHHLFGFRSLPGFGTFPIGGNLVFSDSGGLNLFLDSTYTISRPTGTSTPDRYAIDARGAFSVFVTGGSAEPSVVFRGGYGLVSTEGDFFFTDRVSTPNSQSIGLYYGTRIVAGQVELAGGWHLFSLHTIFDETILAPSNVGRAAHGGVSIATGDPGTVRGVSGAGQQSGSMGGPAALTFGGSIQNLLTTNNGTTGDGTCNLTLDYDTDSRVIVAAASGNETSGNIVFGLDSDESDGEAGIVFLVRKFDALAAPVESVRVPGTFLVGGHTLFVNPSNPGSDAFVGTVTLTSQFGFRLDAVGNQGMDFSYVGSYTLSPEGLLTISISGTNETWFAAIDRNYQTLVFVDDWVETRSNNIPELNLGIGVREKAQ